MESVVNCTSLIGTRSTARSGATVRCVSGSKVRIDSSVSPKKSSRIGSGIDGAKRSRMPPRTAYSPVSRTAEARAKPLFSSHCVRLVILTALPGAAEKEFGRDFFARRHALQDGVDRRRENARAPGGGARTRKPRQHRHPPRRDRRIGRDAIIGLAIPAGEIEHLDLRRGEGQRFVEGAGALLVARDMDEHDGALLRRRRQRPGEIGDAKGIEPVRQGGQDERAFLASSAVARLRSVTGQSSDASARASDMDRPGMGMKPAQPPNTGVSKDDGISSFARQPAENVAILRFEKRLVIVNSASLRWAISASAKRPISKSVSRMPRCHERNKARLRRGSSICVMISTQQAVSYRHSALRSAHLAGL